MHDTGAAIGGAFDLEWSGWGEQWSRRLGMAVPRRMARSNTEWDRLWERARAWLAEQGYARRGSGRDAWVVHIPRVQPPTKIFWMTTVF